MNIENLNRSILKTKKIISKIRFLRNLKKKGRKDIRELINNNKFLLHRTTK